jgi:predicted nuclease of restriction endonuclease-like (RecB) superfamily
MNYVGLVKAIQLATSQLQGRVAAVANQALVLRNWLVGAYLVEFEQKGKERADYGAKLLETLAADLASKGIKGLGLRMLRDCRSFYGLYPQFRQTLSAEFAFQNSSQDFVNTYAKIPGPLSSKSAVLATNSIRQTLSAELPTSLSLDQILRLSWSHFQELIRLEDPWQRAFYENELIKGQWSVRQLQRQVGSLLYERTGISTEKKAVIERARNQEPRETIADMLRDPYILEFTGLVDRPEYSEQELETALLDHLQKFILELGRGFCFEARQFRMTEGRRHHRVDLLFYHRLLRCHVLIDLKIRAFKPEDAGQMNFYLNWFKANMMTEGDSPPIGIILCSDRDGTEVEFATAGMDQKLFISRYLVALPSAEKLRAFLEADRDQIERLIFPKAPPKKRSSTKKNP